MQDKSCVKYILLMEIDFISRPVSLMISFNTNHITIGKFKNRRFLNLDILKIQMKRKFNMKANARILFNCST